MQTDLKKISYWCFAFFGAILFIFKNGYYYGVSDQTEHLPQVFKLMNPALYPGDFFVENIMKVFSVRTYFTWTLYVLSFIAPVKFWCFVLLLLCLFLQFFAMIKIAERISENYFVSLLAPLILFFVTYKFTLGGNYSTYPIFVCGVVAKTFGLWGLLKYLEKKYFSSGLLLGIGTLYQMLAAGLLFFLLFIISLIFWFKKELGVKKLWTFFLFFIIPASFVIIPIFYRQFFANKGFDKQLYYDIVFTFRNPWHFRPMLFPIKDYVRFSLLYLAGVLILIFYCRGEYRKFFSWVFAIVLIILTGSFIATEVLEKLFVSSFQFFKLTVWLGDLCACLIAVTLFSLLNKIFGKLIQRIFTPKLISTASVILGAGFLFLIFFAGKINIDYLQNRFQIGFQKITPSQKMHQWIKNNTPVNAIFIFPTSDDGFKCEAMRPSPVDYKALIHEPFYMIEWNKRMKEIYGVDKDTDLQGKTITKKCDENFHQFGEEHFCRLKEKYKVDYVVREKNQESHPLDFPITYEDKNDRIYQIVCGKFAVR